MSTIMAADSAAGSFALCSTFLAAFVAALSTLTMGYGQGYPSTALRDLAELCGPRAFTIGSRESDLFAALMPIGALLASPVAGALSDWIGRKTSMLITGIPNVIGWIMIAVSPYVTNPLVFKLVILSGRFLTGISIGCLAVISPYYIAEVALSKYRGLFTAFFHLSVITGVFLSYGVGSIPALSYSQSAVVIAGIVVIFEILMLVVPESPRWLLSKGHEAQALKALQWLRRSEEIAREEAGEINKFIETAPKLSLKEKLVELRKRHVYQPVILMLLLMFINQCSGLNVITTYAAPILSSGGIGDTRVRALYCFGLPQLIAAIISSLLVDRVGRKALLILAGIGVTLGNVGLGTYFYISWSGGLTGNDTSQNTTVTSSNITATSFNIPWSGDCEGNDTSNSNNSTIETETDFTPLAICSFVVFSFIHGLGWRCVPSIMRAEVYPLRLRGFLGGINDFAGWLMIALVVGSYYPFGKAIGQSGVWWSFATLSFLGVFFIIAFIPETKGKTLEEIETHFKTNHSICSCTRVLTAPFVKNKATNTYDETDV